MKLPMKNKDIKDFEKAVEVVMKYLANPKLFHPHVKIIIDSTNAELVEGIVSLSRLSNQRTIGVSMKVLNLYAGIGGNRKLWTDVEVTAVENNESIAAIYQDFFPDDKVIVADAHQYLLDHFKEYDFIWSSPPCPTHSQIRYNIGFKANRKYRKVDAVYPDMQLYQEIILLDKWYDGKWVVENTIPYYEPLIDGLKTGGHIWWSNFNILEINIGNRNHRGGTVDSLQERKNIDISKYDIQNKRQILRNCVEPELGLHILECARGNYNHLKS